MAIAQITLYPGRTAEQKRKLVQAVTQALVDAGSSPDKCFVVLHEVEAPNWGVQGEYALDNPRLAAGYDRDGNKA